MQKLDERGFGPRWQWRPAAHWRVTAHAPEQPLAIRVGLLFSSSRERSQVSHRKAPAPVCVSLTWQPSRVRPRSDGPFANPKEPASDRQADVAHDRLPDFLRWRASRLMSVITNL